MSVVIVGGNECMERKYKELCASYQCSAKVFTKMKGCGKRFGSPDLLVLFTNAMSHKMLQKIMCEVDEDTTRIVHSRSGSATALRRILECHVTEVGANV